MSGITLLLLLIEGTGMGISLTGAFIKQDRVWRLGITVQLAGLLAAVATLP